jgi:uncharacterized membrane protein
MSKSRLEAFSDGVIAILITIMVLDLRVPMAAQTSALIPLWPVFLSYLLSFVFLAIYWNNHHHLMQAVRSINGSVLWANTHLLFWLSLTPFVTAWMGENHFAPVPVALYGVDLLCAGVAYYILTRTLLSVHGRNSVLAKALGSDVKGKASMAIYALGILLACRYPAVACGLYALVSVIWLVPDRRIENILLDSSERP